MPNYNPKPNFLVGCSGYYYSQWKGDFYPADLPATQWLRYYSSVFRTVELNSTFYKAPTLPDLEKYAASTPPDFRFSVKMNRYVTHVLKLTDAKDEIMDFIHLVEDGLKEKLDKVLFQLPPFFKYNDRNVEALLKSIPPSAQHVIEFRDISWWNKSIETLFRKQPYTFCNVDYPGLRDNFLQTSKHFYLRMHGVPELFKSCYTEAELRHFYDKLPSNSDSYHIYFNNTYYDAAYKNALSFSSLNVEGN